MSVSCPHCGAVASYGREIGHRSDCPGTTPRERQKVLSVVRDGVGGMYPAGPVFHWRAGWYFCRGEMNVVHVWNIDKKVDLEIPDGEWASIVAALK